MKSFNLKSFLYRSTAFVTITSSILFYQNCSKPFVAKNPATDSEFSLASSSPSVAPVLQVLSSPNSITNSPNANITFSATAGSGSQIASIRCTFDSAAPVDCMQGSFNRSAIADGNHVLRIVATDNKGVPSREQIVTWIVDTAAPVVSFLSAPADNGTISTSSVNITFSQPTDMSGISSVTCSYGNSLASIASNPINCANNSIALSGLTAGSVYVRVRVIDMAQNPFNLDKNFTYAPPPPNVVIPLVTLVSVPQAISNVTTFTFTYTGTLSGQSINNFECALDAQAYAACNGGSKIYSQAELTEGSHTFNVRSIDTTTNVRSDIRSQQFIIDRTAPVVTISSPAAGSTLIVASTNAVFTVTDSNLTTVTRICRLDNVQMASCSSPVPLNNLSNGSHTFSVTATDGASNPSTVSRTFNVNVPALVNKTLAWDASLDANNAFDSSVASYNIYVGTAPGIYNPAISAAAGATPSQVLNNLVVGQTYYIAVSAVNVAGESDRSTVLTYVAQ